MVNVLFRRLAPMECPKLHISVIDLSDGLPIGSITQSDDGLYFVRIHRKNIPSHIALAPHHTEHFFCMERLINRTGASTFKSYTARYMLGSDEDALDEIMKSVLNGNLVSCGEDSCITQNIDEAKEVAAYLANVMPSDLVFTQAEIEEMGFSTDQMKLYFERYRIIGENTDAKFTKIA